MGAAGSAELHALQLQVGRVGVRGTYVGSVHVRKDALRSLEEHGGSRAGAAGNHSGETKSVLQGSIRGTRWSRLLLLYSSSLSSLSLIII